jgi:hypothetical protein
VIINVEVAVGKMNGKEKETLLIYDQPDFVSSLLLSVMLNKTEYCSRIKMPADA